MRAFVIDSPYDPAGDQPQAIEALSQGFLRGDRYQTLKGVTGSGKTFTMAKIIVRFKKQRLLLATIKRSQHNSIVNLKVFFQTMLSNTLSPIMIIINQKPTSLRAIST